MSQRRQLSILGDDYYRLFRTSYRDDLIILAIVVIDGQKVSAKEEQVVNVIGYYNRYDYRDVVDYGSSLGGHGSSFSEANNSTSSASSSSGIRDSINNYRSQTSVIANRAASGLGR